MTKRKLPETSLDAYRNLDQKELSQTKRDILYALSQIKEGTFEDIASFMGCKPDKIWKRLGELKKDNLIHRNGARRVLKSGATGFIWVLTAPGLIPQKITESVMPGRSISDYSKAMSGNFKQSNLF